MCFEKFVEHNNHVNETSFRCYLIFYWNILYKCIGIELRSICGRIDLHVSLVNDNLLQSKYLKTSKNYIFRVLWKSGFSKTGSECYVLVLLRYKWVVFTCRVVYAYSEWISMNSENCYGILMLLLKVCTNLSKNVYLSYFFWIRGKGQRWHTFQNLYLIIVFYNIKILIFP